QVESIGETKGRYGDELVEREANVGGFGRVGVAENGSGGWVRRGCLIGERNCFERNAVDFCKNELAGADAKKQLVLSDGLGAVREDGAEIVVDFRNAGLIDDNDARGRTGQWQLADLCGDGGVERRGIPQRGPGCARGAVVREHPGGKRNLADELSGGGAVRAAVDLSHCDRGGNTDEQQELQGSLNHLSLGNTNLLDAAGFSFPCGTLVTQRVTFT